jgi:hypothetical protein
MLCVVEQPDSMATAALAASKQRTLMISLLILFSGLRVIGSVSDTLSEQACGKFASRIIAAIYVTFSAGLEVGLSDFSRTHLGKVLADNA